MPRRIEADAKKKKREKEKTVPETFPGRCGAKEVPSPDNSARRGAGGGSLRGGDSDTRTRTRPFEERGGRLAKTAIDEKFCLTCGERGDEKRGSATVPSADGQARKERDAAVSCGMMYREARLPTLAGTIMIGERAHSSCPGSAADSDSPRRERPPYQVSNEHDKHRKSIDVGLCSRERTL